LSSASFANVASTRGRVFGAFRVDVVTCQTRQHSPRRVAWTRQTHRHSPSRVARSRQTRRHSPSRVARTRQTRQHALWRVFEKNVTRLDTFARVTRESREFGASGHCLEIIELRSERESG
jgi:hypothetical protein